MNRVVIITGASRGLGARLAQYFSDKGFAVAVNYNESKDKAEDLVQALRENGRDAVAIPADVSKPDQVRSMVDTVLSLWGRIDVLVNNAGVVSDSLLVKTSNHVWEKIIKTNLSGIFTCIRAVSEIMVKQGEGHIINISSISGVHGQVGQAAYAASKAGILGLSMSAAKELGEYNIRVNTVLPGYLLTDMGMSADRARDQAAKISVLHKLSSLDEVACFVVNLTQMTSISGQVFNLDSRV
ncbi:SDR family NAD(P)-dependent oxidoreductase [Candidatus Desantisbacteria bacterium]|nr:SDR family NAD(P)-dependent oxidoreductase [Candidatus Desantisbacteria bacterium]